MTLWPCDQTWGHVKSWKYYIFTFLRLMTTKFGRVVTSRRRFTTQTPKLWPTKLLVAFPELCTLKNTYIIGRNAFWLKKIEEKIKNSSESTICVFMLLSRQEIRHSLSSDRGINKVEGHWLVVFILTPIEAIGPWNQSWFELYNFFSFLLLKLRTWKTPISVEVGLNLSTFSIPCSISY